jgi:glycosyltransferase involved in cell wall biosynthesis
MNITPPQLRISMQFYQRKRATSTVMTVSVVIPTYNRPKRLQRALEHLQAQREPDWEALVVDDGDGQGVALALSLADPRIRTFMNAGKQQVDARNTAIVQARGDIIAWLDDDDWWEHPDHVANLKQTLSEPGLVHVHGWVVREQHKTPSNHKAFSNYKTPSNQKTLNKHKTPSLHSTSHHVDSVNETREVFSLPATTASLRRDNTLLTSSIAYPKRLHQELGLLDRSLNGYFDWDWIIRVLDAGYPLTTLALLSVCYAMHGGNGSAQVDNPRRVRDFTAFRDKHNLDITIKSHDAVLQEHQPQEHQPDPIAAD